MNERRIEPRHENSALPSELCVLFLTLPGGVEVISKLVNLSSRGILLTVPTDEFYTGEESWMGQTVEVNFPLKNIRIPGECINVYRNLNRTLSIGIYFTNPCHHQRLSEIFKTAAVSRMLAV